MKCETIRGPFSQVNATDFFAVTDDSDGKPIKVTNIPIALLPCPFCGGEAKFVMKGPYQSQFNSNMYCLYLAQCKVCGAQSDVNYVRVSSMDFEEDGYFDLDYFLPAERLWNSRFKPTKKTKGIG